MRATERLDINRTLQEFARRAEVPVSRLAPVLGLSASDLALQLWGKLDAVGVREIDALERVLGVSLSDVVAGRVNRNLLRSRFLGEPTALPDRYLDLPLSRVRSTANIVEYLRLSRGWNQTRQLLHSFQMHEGVFERHDQAINFQFFLDLFSAVNQMGVSTSEYRLMAFHSAVLQSQTPFGSALTRASNDHELYQLFFERLTGFDTNFVYKLEMTCDRATFVTRVSEQLQGAFRSRIVGSREICLYKQQIVAAVSVYVGLHPLHVHETSCLYLGDRECRYSVPLRPYDYSMIKPSSKRLRSC